MLNVLCVQPMSSPSMNKPQMEHRGCGQMQIALSMCMLYSKPAENADNPRLLLDSTSLICPVQTENGEHRDRTLLLSQSRARLAMQKGQSRTSIRARSCPNTPKNTYAMLHKISDPCEKFDSTPICTCSMSLLTRHPSVVRVPFLRRSVHLPVCVLYAGLLAVHLRAQHLVVRALHLRDRHVRPRPIVQYCVRPTPR
jgi:hypothetical protein